MAPAVVLWPLGNFLGIHVAASGKPSWVFLASLGSLALAPGICWYMITRYGAVGSGLSVSMIYAAWTFFRMLAYRRATGAGFADLLVPCRADWVYYRRLMGIPLSRFSKRAQAS